MILIGKENVDNYKRRKFEPIIKILYNNFTDSFKSGDIIISGGLSYIHLNLIDVYTVNDLDIGIRNNEKGLKLLNNIIFFFKHNIECTIEEKDKINLKYFICTEFGGIDFFLNDFDGIPIEFELYDGITSYYYGHEWLLNTLIDLYNYFDNLSNPTEYEIKQKTKKKKLIENIYNKVKNDISKNLSYDIKKLIYN